MSKNVYVCQFSLDKAKQYIMEASIKDSGFTYPDLKGILSSMDTGEDRNEISNKKEKYHPFALKLCDANHFFRQSKVVPDALWVGVDDREIKLPTNQDYIFSIWNGGRIFNQACATILKKHRLGETILTPVQIYDLSTGKLVSDETYYFLNLYERREYICEVQPSKYLKSIPVGCGAISFSGFIKDRGVDVNESALDCDLDLWYDPKFIGRFFMSDKLYHSLKENNMIDKFSPLTCNLIR